MSSKASFWQRRLGQRKLTHQRQGVEQRVIYDVQYDRDGWREDADTRPKTDIGGHKRIRGGGGRCRPKRLLHSLDLTPGSLNKVPGSLGY